MKKFAKFIPVALGLLTLASCSNDEIFSESQDGVKLEKGDMLVTMTEPQEDGEAFTRGYTSRDMKSRRWYSGVDELLVYGEQFGAFDTYQFKQGIGEATGKFQIVSNPSYVANPMWALFPKNQITNGTWQLIGGLYNSSATVDVIIPQLVTYDAAYDAANYSTNKQPYYLDDLPRWGKIVSIHGGDYLETKLNWMTGILRLQLAGTPKYSNGIKVQLFENGDRTKPIRLNSVLGKNFTVKIAQNNEPIPGACIEYDTYATSAETDGALYIYIPEIEKLTDADKQKAVVYLPLPVTPKKQVDIVVSVWNWSKSKSLWSGKINSTYTSSPLWESKKDGSTYWKEYAVYKNKSIKLGNVYGNKSEYNLALDGTNPGAISDALQLIETDKDVITVVANNPIDVCEGSKQTTIEIPNKVGKKQIILDLRKGLDGCDADQTLNIVYADATDKFEGNVTLLTPDADGTHPVLLNVDLDKSSFSIVQGKSLQQDKIDIDAREFVVGNDDPLTPTPAFTANLVKFSNNVKKFWVASEASINSFAIDQSDVNPENWKHGAVEEIVINGTTGIGGGAIDALSLVKKGYEVAVKVEGENANTADILTNGTVDINAGLYDVTPATVGVVTAGKAVTATGWATIGTITSLTETVALSGNVSVDGDVVAKGNINIIEEANVPTYDITSEEGNITIDNAYTAAATYAGAISADKGIVSLNQVGTDRTMFSGDIIANEFVMTGLTAVTSAATVTAHGTATINVDAQDGACGAIAGNLTLDHPTANKLNLFQGYVKKLNNDLGETELTFASTAAYAAIADVSSPDKLKPTNTSIWNGDYELTAYPNFEAWGYNIDGGRIWTATQLGYQNITATDGDVIICSDIDLDNQSWPGIVQTAATNVRSSDETKAKTISNLKLIGNNTTKTAGFYTTCADALTVTNLTFDGVSTEIKGVSGGVYDGGIGAVAGKLMKGATLTRVKVTLAGTNFGATLGKNAQTANVGGLLGATGWANLNGCQVDATGVALTGYKCMGGFIGRSYDVVNIKMYEGDDSKGIAEVYPTVTGLSFNVTYDLTQGLGAKTNDPDQGTTGWFIGSIDVNDNLTITDVKDADVKRDIVQATGSLANEAVASLITTTSTLYYFRRDAGKADQTLVGNSGFYTSTPDDTGVPGIYRINGVRFCIYKANVAVAEADAPRFYSLNLNPYKP